jgi:hypothetical protein
VLWALLAFGWAGCTSWISGRRSRYLACRTDPAELTEPRSLLEGAARFNDQEDARGAGW